MFFSSGPCHFCSNCCVLYSFYKIKTILVAIFFKQNTNTPSLIIDFSIFEFRYAIPKAIISRWHFINDFSTALHDWTAVFKLKKEATKSKHSRVSKVWSEATCRRYFDPLPQKSRLGQLIPLFKVFQAKTAIIKNTVRLLYESKYRVQLRHNAGAAKGEAERGPETCLKLHG